MDIRKSITVRRPIQTTFTAFTAEIGQWWPLKNLSFGRERAKDLFLEGRTGGRLYERFTDGDEYTIGNVTLYEAPSRVTFTWQQPDWNGPTEVDVRFTTVAEGTLVELEHRGWEAAGAAQAAGSYDQGWGFILKLFGQVMEG